MHEKKRQSCSESNEVLPKKRKRLESHKSKAFGQSVVEIPLENSLLTSSQVALNPFDLFETEMNLTCPPVPTNQAFNAAASSSAGALEMLLREENHSSQEVKQPFLAAANDPAAIGMPSLDFTKIMEEVSTSDGGATTTSSSTSSSLTATASTSSSVPACANLSTFIDYNVHSPSCGHLSIHHGNHLDYVVNNHLICQNSVKKIKPFHINCPTQGPVQPKENQPQPSQRPQQVHRPGCGHLPVRHKDHIDYVVEDNLFCQHAGLIVDETDKIELLDDDFWEFYGAIGSL
jgi:hypothetical protein